MSFWRVADKAPATWAEQRTLTEPRATAIAELVAAVTGADLAKAQRVVEAITVQGSLFTAGQAWQKFRSVTAPELKQAGLTEKQAIKLLAAIELGKRVFTASPEQRPVIDDPRVAAEMFRYEIGDSEIEQFAVMALDAKHRVVAVRTIAVGTKTECLVDPSEVFGFVIKSGASRLIVAHNHPSGVTDPSPEDIGLTRTLLRGAKMLRLPLLDHLIVSGDKSTSLREMTGLWQECPQE